MNGSDQRRFLSKVRRALGVDGPRRAPEGLFLPFPPERSRRLLERVRQRKEKETAALVKLLRQAAAPLNISLYTAADRPSAAGIVAQIAAAEAPEWGGKKSVSAWRHPLIEALNLPEALEVPVHFSKTDPALVPAEGRRKLREQIADSFIGVTAADFCLADTATVVLRTRPGQARSVSLLPSIHVAIVEAGRILASLAELYAVLRWEPEQQQQGLSTCLSLITGPSKTADIEATLVHGAHGPRALHLIVLV